MFQYVWLISAFAWIMIYWSRNPDL